jgi:uncharacterized protein (TIGR02246 family)
MPRDGDRHCFVQPFNQRKGDCMRYSVTSTLIVMTAAALAGGWTLHGQVQERAKPKSVPAKKTEASAKQPDTDAKDGGTKKSLPAPAAEPKELDRETAVEPDNKDAVDRQAILHSAEKFVTVYNAHDAKAVSELFALRAEFADEDGNLIQGREAIEQDFAQMFEEHPQCAIDIEVNSIRMLTPNIAVEEGLVHGLPEPDREPNTSSYVAVHIKVEGKWLIGSVSDYQEDTVVLTAHDHLQELAWMVGDWQEENPEAILHSSCRWDDSGNFLLLEFVVQIAGRASASGSMRIGWDPLARQFKTWTFNADGSHAEGLWNRVGDEWQVKMNGVDTKGEVTSSVSVFRYIDDETMSWRAYDRVIGGEPTADIPENVIKRSPPHPEG